MFAKSSKETCHLTLIYNIIPFLVIVSNGDGEVFAPKTYMHIYFILSVFNTSSYT